MVESFGFLTVQKGCDKLHCGALLAALNIQRRDFKMLMTPKAYATGREGNLFIMGLDIVLLERPK